MIDLKQFVFWFIRGSQHLFGPTALEKVAANASQFAASLDAAPGIPCSVLFQPVIQRAEVAAEMQEDFGQIAGLETFIIDDKTTVREFLREWRATEVYYALARGLAS
jgi:L-arabinose isomerase